MSALFDLKGRTVLVTGGTKGIGQSMTLGLAEAGADVIVLQVGLGSDFAVVDNMGLIIYTERPGQSRYQRQG